MKNILIYDHYFLNSETLKDTHTNIFSLHGEPHIHCKCEFCLLKKNHVINLDLPKRFKFQKFDKKVQDLSEINLNKLIIFLNKYHKIDLDYRSWKLILWPWLLSFTSIILEITTKLQMQDFTKDKKAVIHRASLHNVIPKNYVHYTELFKGKYFHNYILSILAKKHFLNLQVKEKNTKFSKKVEVSIIIKYLRIFFSFFTRRSKYILFRTYLPLIQKIKISLKSRSMPVFQFLIDENFVNEKKSLLKLRESAFDEKDEFLSILKLLIPNSYLENFKIYYNRSLQVFSNNPKLIYTANAYIDCDLFKIWSAHHLNNVRFIAAQHGGHYGVGKLSFYNKFEYQVPDFFLSWGWSDKNFSNVIPIGNWTNEVKNKNHKRKNLLYLIGSGSDKYICSTISMALGNQWKKYILDIKKFLNYLKIEDCKILLRPYHANITWENEKIYEKVFHDFEIENTNKKIEINLSQAKLVICTWNSTNFLNLLSSNIPTITFWKASFFPIEENAKPYLDELFKANILHFNYKSAASFVNKIWSDVDNWWASDVTQNARKKFISIYSCNPNRNLENLEKILFFKDE